MPNQYKLPSLAIRKDWFPATEEGRTLYEGLSNFVLSLNRLLYEINLDRERVIIEKEVAEPADGAAIATLYLDVADGDFKIKFPNDTVKTLATN